MLTFVALSRPFAVVVAMTKCCTSGCEAILMMDACKKCDPVWRHRLYGWYAKGSQKFCPTCNENSGYEAQTEEAERHCCRICVQSASQSMPPVVSVPKRGRSKQQCSDCPSMAPWSDCQHCDSVWQARANEWYARRSNYTCRECCLHRGYSPSSYPPSICQSHLCRLCIFDVNRASGPPPTPETEPPSAKEPGEQNPLPAQPPPSPVPTRKQPRVVSPTAPPTAQLPKFPWPYHYQGVPVTCG
jgi:hypothetical protein